MIRSQETGRNPGCLSPGTGAGGTRSATRMEDLPMSTISTAARTTAVNLPTWAWLAMALALGMLYAVTFDTGVLSSHVASSGMYLHELFHDGRHLFGVPCH